MNCVFNAMITLTQTKCEAKKLDLMKVISESGQKMCIETDCVTGTDQLNSLCLHLRDDVQIAIPDPFPDRGHFIFEKDDFRSLLEKTETVLRFVNIVLEISNHNGVSDLKPLNECLPHLLVILSSNMRNNLWTGDSTPNLALRVMNQLRILYKVDSLLELLQLDVKNKDRETVTPSSCLLGQYFGVVQARLTKHDWQANPTFVESFAWMLTQMMKFPHLSDYLDVVLPPALLFIDSHVTEQKVVGIQCLQHIAANVSNEQLRWYGRADVVYTALKQQVYSREPEIIRVLHPALLTLLPIIDRSPAPSDPPQEPPLQVDFILSTVITCAVTENGLVLRRLYSQCIPDYISSLGLRSVRHLRKLVELVCDYLEVCDAPEEQARCNALDILHALLQNAWPRVPPYADQIVKSLLKLLQDLTSKSAAVTPERVAQKLNSQASLCLDLLTKTCPDVGPCLQEIAQTPELKELSVRICGVTLAGVK